MPRPPQLLARLLGGPAANQPRLRPQEAVASARVTRRTPEPARSGRWIPGTRVCRSHRQFLATAMGMRRVARISARGARALALTGMVMGEATSPATSYRPG